MATSLRTLVFMSIFYIAQGDVYLHVPRGSNNRLDETSRNRANANNLFDSQNNDRGGYNVGSVFYYQGSVLPIEWTNQHSCYDQNNHCDFVLQYMCDDTVRDGTTTQTIPSSRGQCENYDCNSDRRYRMNEDYNFYRECKLRSRNKGLFIADQNLKGEDDARYTRQNPQGTRRGYECPEERDYYPYWHPSPWVDIAVLTDDVSRCSFYQQESENVKQRWACVFPDDVMEIIMGSVVLPNNKEECQSYVLPDSIDLSSLGSPARTPEWLQFPSHGVPAPDCREAEWTRDNHLGNTLGAHPPMYNWTIPTNLQNENCVLRIRYNITSTDYSAWETDASANADENRLGAGTNVPMAEKFGFSDEDEADDRGFVFEDDPVVKLFEGVDLDLRLAIDTAQFSRVFQDRSHTFAVRPVPSDLNMESDATIYNLNVRGKRGNIVQVYPAVEYDFVPNNLEVAVGDYVHIQWTGSNTNNNNNDGQGLAGSDRSNIVLLQSPVYPKGSGPAEDTYGHLAVNYPMDATDATFLGLSQDDALTLAYVDPGQFRGEVSELDDAGTYFNLPLRKVTKAGTYNYMSTRNNNFSNRDQKGIVFVNTSPFANAAIGQLGGNVSLKNGEAMVVVGEGTFDSLKKVRLEQWSISDGESAMEAANSYLTSGDNYASDFFYVSPEDLVDTDASDSSFTVEIKLSHQNDIEVYRASSDFAAWSRAEADIGGGVARIQAQSGGVYVARGHSNVAMIIGVTIACVAVVAIIVGGTIFYFRRHPKKWQAVKTTCTKAELSMHSKV